MKKHIKISRLIICVLFISLYALSATLAKYTSSLNGSGQAQIAKFEILAETNTSNQKDYSFTLGDVSKTKEWIFSITSNSEVAIKYDIVLNLSNELPKNNLVNFSIDTENPSINGTIYTFESIGSFGVGGGTNSHSLAIEIIDFKYRIDISITIDIIARQII